MRRSFKRHVGLNGVYNGDSEFMAGESIMFSGPADKIPAGYLIEDGAEVGRVAYATLFAAIGTTYGAGDGATTFNLPDSRGEVWRGLDLSAGRDVGRVLGSKQGDAIKGLKMAKGHSVSTYLSAAQGADGYLVYPIGRDVTGGETSVMSGTGGAETRMRNIAKIPLIKY